MEISDQSELDPGSKKEVEHSGSYMKESRESY